ncbi:hypothetical protein C1H46_041677 [Malus baccata]|uniref:Pentacotripeptide-repeat region of PRORP domain-containing protein n=1 Tax=Malus baccata TaxID=106549 RepID=A0A540KEU3_MALBA|nr:hypothetical protein C1H46_041677 [Malus baccata]
MKAAKVAKNHPNNKADGAASLLKSCTSLCHLKQIHAHIVRSNLHRNASLASALISFYASLCASPRYTHLVFTSFSNPNLSLFNHAVRAFSKISVLCFEAVGRARKLFDEMCERDVVSYNAVLGPHARGGVDMGSALVLFEGMLGKSVISWNAMVLGYVNSGDLVSARAVYDRMPDRNAVSWTTMLMGYTKSGFMDKAKALFDEMPERGLICWTAIISGYSQNGRPSEALSFFRRMEKARVKPDAFTMKAVISALAQLGRADLANWIGSYVDREGIEQNEQLLTALVDMHAKCGNMEEACAIFEKIPLKDVFSYSAIITGLASNGHGVKVLEIFPVQ